ncbi:MAG: calcium-binding protein [Phycisphaerales bacterium]|nr:calcium-binding protein [Phycisphaerales bacterium]
MQIETLEVRQLMSATLNPATHLLTVNGTGGNDVINVALSADGKKVVVTQNGATQSFLKSQVTKIKASGYAGNDDISIGTTVKIPAELHAGPGPGPVNYLKGETLRGGGGNDALYADSPTNALLYGRGGNDAIHTASESAAYGGDGNDTIFVDGIEVTAHGENGDDAFVIHAAAQNYVYGGAGTDKADFSGFAADQVIGNSSALQALGLGLWSGPGATTSYESGCYVADDVEVLAGGKGNDQLYAGAGAHAVYGNDGNDTLYGGAGKCALFGGNGNDYLMGSGLWADFLSGGNGYDTIDRDVLGLDTSVGVERSL